ncbi:hypothetical protein [Leptospira stimsonii]|nr:hypothetical protein [Leptospira stimsonii]
MKTDRKSSGERIDSMEWILFIRNRKCEDLFFSSCSDSICIL